MLSLVKRGVSEFDNWLLRIYGPVVRFYEGRRLNILISDPVVIREIFIDRSDVFYNRQVFDSVNLFPLNLGLPSLQDEDWDRVRYLCSGFFSDSSLRQQIKIMNYAYNNYIDSILTNSSSHIVDLEVLFSKYAAKVIGCSLFGVEGSAEETIQQQIVLQAINDLKNPAHKELKFAALALFPFASKIFKIFNLQLLDYGKVSVINDYIKHVIENQQQSLAGENYCFLAYASSLITEDIKTNQGITFDEMVAQCITFYIAGHHTTASTLMFTIYHLATNPDFQERAFNEAGQLKEEEKLIETLIKGTSFIHACIMESLRLYSPTVRIDRVAKYTTKISNNITIPAGATLIVPLPSLHKRPDYFENPLTFNPLRTCHSVDEKLSRDFKCIPFGCGHRYCTGKKLAMVILTFTIIELVLRFEFRQCPKTE
ncbi:hypothetical protein GJ496_005688, partial [Pomphorhynchus laevis]